jgi:hypothetical protein
MNCAGIGPRVDWQEWFGGYYWLQIEFWLGPWFVGLEITNRDIGGEAEL